MSIAPSRPAPAGSAPDRAVENLAPTLLVRARAAADERGLIASPAAVLLHLAQPMPILLALGSPEEVGRHPAARGATVVDRPDCTLLPGLVNAHTHLDLTSVGPRPIDPAGGFPAWLGMIRRERPTEPAAIGRAVRRGVLLSLAGGTVAVGDIAGAAGGVPTLAAWRALRASPLMGTSYLEFFGIGPGEEGAAARVEAALAEARQEARAGDAAGGVVLGLSPHAPMTVAEPLFRWAASRARRDAMPISTHLAESLDERRLIARGEGPMRDLLERVGMWDARAAAGLGRGAHPARHLEAALAEAPFAVAHANDAPDEAIEVLARTGSRVVYCPRASTYFDAPRALGPHRYREMMAAGVVVALGTDSIVNLPGSAASERVGVSVLDEMRVLRARDGTDWPTLIRMGTTAGATAIGLEPGLFRFAPGAALAGLVAVPGEARTGDALADTLGGDGRPDLLLLRNRSGLAIMKEVSEGAVAGGVEAVER